jgi:G:T-mismatch repair DNA endonuclease (very short patch repair protein)
LVNLLAAQDATPVTVESWLAKLARAVHRDQTSFRSLNEHSAAEHTKQHPSLQCAPH